MPEKGENISLYFQNANEMSSIAVNAVRRNGGNCSKTSNPAIKYLGIPSGQEFKLGEVDIDFVESADQYMTLNNNSGVDVRTSENLNIFAKHKLALEANEIIKIASNSSGVVVGTGQSADRAQFALEGGAGGNANVYATGNILNDGRFKEVLADRLNEEIAYTEKHFNFWEALGKALAVIAIVAVVALLAVATCGLSLAACAVIVGCTTVFVAAQMADDWYNDTTSSFADYLLAGAQGALAGVMIVAFPVIAPFLGPLLPVIQVVGTVMLASAFANEIVYAYECIRDGKRWNPAGAIRLVGTVAIGFGYAKYYKSQAGKSECGDPVDAITGIMIVRSTDFELPGPIPLRWRRTWYSDSYLVGQLGHSMRHCYEMGLDVYEEEKALVVYLGDGRQVQYPYLLAGEEYFSYQDKVLLKREADCYIV